jgi:sodium-dependent dicarboxylate transporter 2/3/5
MNTPPENDSRRQPSRLKILTALLVAAGLGTAGWLVGPGDVGKLLAVLGVVITLWISEVIPLYATSLGIPVALSLLGLGSAREVLAPFFDPIIVLFFAGFLMAEAMKRVGLDRMIALAITEKIGRGPKRLFIGLLGLAAGMSMVMSNTATVVLLVPIVLTVTEPLGSLAYKKALVLGVAFASTVGGVGSAIGTPANPLAIKFLRELTGHEVHFVQWFAFGLPFVFLFLPLLAVYLWWRVGVSLTADRFEEAANAARQAREEAGPMTSSQRRVLAVFVLCVLGWLTEAWHHQSSGIVALTAAVALLVLGYVESADLGEISWPTLLTFGGGLTLGLAMVQTGATAWLTEQLTGLASLPPFLGVAAFATGTLALTTVASNTASAATLIPLAVPMAALMGVDPVLLVVVVAIASSIDFALVIGTPPTMIAYSTKLFTPVEILKLGVWLDLAGLILLVTVIPFIWRWLGVL